MKNNKKTQTVTKELPVVNKQKNNKRKYNKKQLGTPKQEIKEAVVSIKLSIFKKLVNWFKRLLKI